MSLTIKSSHSAKQLIPFLESEYKKGTNIPVHLFSVVNADFKFFNKSLGICDDVGAIFFEEQKQWKSYGSSNPLGILKALGRCNVKTKIL